MASDLALSDSGEPSFRVASANDADAVAHLHAESWRRHYRGAYADAFLDGDVLADRLATWNERLRATQPPRYTLLAEARGELIGFANTYPREDARWGSLLDNLHVAASHQRRRVGARLLTLTAEAIVERCDEGERGLYLWVLEQNLPARAFYEALGASFAGSEAVTAPGGVPGRLQGTPLKLRFAWADAGALVKAAP